MSTATGLFTSLIDDGLKRLDVTLSQPTQSYLSEMLFLYIKSDRLFENDPVSGKNTLKTIAEMYLESQQSSLKTQTFLLKKIADQSLYLGGFFREFLERKSVGLDYYLELGQCAYGHLAYDHPLSDIFYELSLQFINLTDAMSYIASRGSIRTDEDLVHLCKKYLSTGSKSIACQLEDHNVLSPVKQSYHKFI